MPEAPQSIWRGLLWGEWKEPWKPLPSRPATPLIVPANETKAVIGEGSEEESPGGEQHLLPTLSAPPHSGRKALLTS